MSRYALQLIETERQTKTGYLDLGCCGLSDDNAQVWEALGSLTHLETLILSNVWNHKLPIIDELYEKNTAQIISILLRDCDWLSTPYSQLQAVPFDPETGQLLPISKWPDNDEAWLEVVRKINQLIESRI